MVDKSRVTRRTALCLIGGGAVATASNGFETFGFTNTEAVRGTTVDVADDQSALIGLLVNDTVRKNSTELLVEVTNNLTEQIDVTVSLDDPNQGTLYGPNGSGDSVSFSVLSTNSKTVDIEPTVKDVTIPFTITATTPNSEFSFQGTRETDAVAGNKDGAVTISKFKNYQASAAENQWTIDRIKVESTVDARELDRVEYEITNEAGDTVRTYEENASGDVYERKQNEGGVTIEPVDGSLSSGEEYTITVTAYDDADPANFDAVTDSDTA